MFCYLDMILEVNNMVPKIFFFKFELSAVVCSNKPDGIEGLISVSRQRAEQYFYFHEM